MQISDIIYTSDDEQYILGKITVVNSASGRKTYIDCGSFENE